MWVWNLVFYTEGRTQRVAQKRVQMRIFGSKRDEVTGG
jgi:hypothetical protein